MSFILLCVILSLFFTSFFHIFLSFFIFFICNFYDSSFTSGYFPYTFLKLLFIFPHFLYSFWPFFISSITPFTYVFFSPFLMSLFIFHFLPWRISLSTALFSLSYVTVDCDIYNSIKLYIKLTFSLIVSCIIYWIE
jgi:hypothetical protein